MLTCKHTIMQLSLDASVFAIIILVFSVIIHEVAHGWAANTLGDPTARLAGRLTLNPLPHIDIIGSVLIPAFLIFSHAGILFGWAKPVPYNPYNLKNQRWGEAFVAGAGPLSNILIAILFAIIFRASFFLHLPTSAMMFAQIVIIVNLFLGFFNLIPIPPFDGYTLLTNALPYRYAVSMRNFESRIRALGPIALLVALFIFITVLSEPFYAFVIWIFKLLVGG